jgi:hypothetical protein
MLGALGSVAAAVPEALALGLDAMGFDSAAFARAGSQARGHDLALLMVYFAGVSQAVGQGVVLFLNRVPPARFALSLALMGAIYLASALITAVSTMLAADLAFGMRLGFGPTIGVVALAHAPRLLGCLTLAPYLGELLDRLLDVWILALMLFGLHVGLSVPIEGAVLSAGLGWVAIRLLWLAFGRPLTAVMTALKHAAAGGPLTLDAHGLVDAVKAKARDADRREGGE